MGNILKDLQGVDVIADDILIYGKTIEENNQRLEAVLKRAREVGLTLNPDKSKICKMEVQYVGHVLTNKGLNPERIR